MGDNALDFLRKKVEGDEVQRNAVNQLLALTHRARVQPTEESSAVNFLADLTLNELDRQNKGGN